MDLSSYELEFKERENRIQVERMLLTKSYFPLYTSSICISSVECLFALHPHLSLDVGCICFLILLYNLGA